VTELELRGAGGLELQDLVKRNSVCLPVVFVTASDDMPSAIAAFRSGAIDFLRHPEDLGRLNAAILNALQLEAKHRRNHLMRVRVHTCLQRLSEREVLTFLLKGKPAKCIARELGTSPHTVRHQRAKILKKMEVESVEELISLVLPVETALASGFPTSST